MVAGRRPAPPLLAVAGWLLAGFITLPNVLDAVQILSFLPFFVPGLVISPKHIALLRTRSVRVTGLAVLAGGAVAAYVLDHRPGRLPPVRRLVRPTDKWAFPVDIV